LQNACSRGPISTLAGKDDLHKDEPRHDVVYSGEALIANMLSVSSIAHQLDEDRGRPRGEAAQARADWFDPATAISELARGLRPGGGLAIISTHWWETEPPLRDAALEALSEPRERFRSQRRLLWDHTFAGSPFGPLHYKRSDDEQRVDVDGLLILYSTRSCLASLSRDERAALFAWVRPLLAGPYRLPLRHELAPTRLAR
jgi:hypothetical protein